MLNRKLNITLITTLCCLLTGCGGVRTTGFLDQPEARGEVPPELPARILILPFEGDIKVSDWIEEVVRDNLYLLGFKVVDYDDLEQTRDENQPALLDLPGDAFRDSLLQVHEIDGMLKGKVITSNKLTSIVGSIKLELFRVETGQIIWIGSIDSQKWSVKGEKQRSDVRESTTMLMEQIAEDIEEFREALPERETD